MCSRLTACGSSRAASERSETPPAAYAPQVHAILAIWAPRRRTRPMSCDGDAASYRRCETPEVPWDFKTTEGNTYPNIRKAARRI
jgi:hypothetical protein